MKRLFFFFVIIVISINAQEKNKLIVDEKSGKPMIIGYCDRTVFADTNFAWWFNSEYDNYEFSKEVVDSIKENIDGVSFQIVMGSWCSDSRREVPRFFRILDEMKYDETLVTIIATDREKESPEGNMSELDIKFVPTIIVYKEEKEIGRITELPKVTLEKDLLEILK